MSSEKATSLSGYVEVCKSIIREWVDATHGEIRPWFRGHKDASWSLQPTEYRYADLNSDEMISEFQLKAVSILRQPPQTGWEWYFLMRHHKLPTRLLDWTTGALLGLYFALRESDASCDAAVWVLDPWALNLKVLRKPDLLLSWDRGARPYLPRVLGGERRLPDLPIAIVPQFNSIRITVQRGTFTVHGRSQDGLENLSLQRLAKVIIPRDSIIQMRRELWTCGIGEFTVFPELDGLSAEILAAEIE